MFHTVLHLLSGEGWRLVWAPWCSAVLQVGPESLQQTSVTSWNADTPHPSKAKPSLRLAQARIHGPTKIQFYTAAIVKHCIWTCWVHIKCLFTLFFFFCFSKPWMTELQIAYQASAIMMLKKWKLWNTKNIFKYIPTMHCSRLVVVPASQKTPLLLPGSSQRTMCHLPAWYQQPLFHQQGQLQLLEAQMGE